MNHCLPWSIPMLYIRGIRLITEPFALHMPLELSSVAGALDNERAAVHRVDHDVSAVKVWVVAPSASEGDIATSGEMIILRVDVKPGDLLDSLAGRVLFHGSKIKNAETEGVIALEGIAILDVLVVVNSLSQALVVTSLLGRLERADVPDVRDGVAFGGVTDLVSLIGLVVGDEELLPVGVKDPALMGIARPHVRSVRDDRDVLLVGDVETRHRLV